MTIEVKLCGMRHRYGLDLCILKFLRCEIVYCHSKH
jgi:hypothetical protein